MMYLTMEIYSFPETIQTILSPWKLTNGRVHHPKKPLKNKLTALLASCFTRKSYCADRKKALDPDCMARVGVDWELQIIWYIYIATSSVIVCWVCLVHLVRIKVKKNRYISFSLADTFSAVLILYFPVNFTRRSIRFALIPISKYIHNSIYFYLLL